MPTYNLPKLGHKNLPEHLKELIHARKGRLPDWLDISVPTCRKPSDFKVTIAGWLEGADLRQLNKHICAYLVTAYSLKEEEMVVIINKKRDRVAVVLRMFGLVFRTTRPTGVLSAELSASLLTREVLESNE